MSITAMQEEDIREYWSECGAIEDLDLMRFPDTGRFKGIAFITFEEVWTCTAPCCWFASASRPLLESSTKEGLMSCSPAVTGLNTIGSVSGRTGSDNGLAAAW